MNTQWCKAVPASRYSCTLSKTFHLENSVCKGDAKEWSFGFLKMGFGLEGFSFFRLLLAYLALPATSAVPCRGLLVSFRDKHTSGSGCPFPICGAYRHCPQNVCKLQSSYICGEITNQTKNNEAYSGTKIRNYFRNGLELGRF